MKTRLLLLLSGAGLLAPVSSAHAAGGHFDVDDATMLAAERCQVEAWFTRAPAANANVWHLGPGCRVGPVELTLNLDRPSAGAAHGTLVGPQLKWVTDPALGPFAAGLVAGATFDAGHGGRPVWTLYAPLTWTLNDAIAVNLNFGADRDAAGRTTRRVGASGEWTLNDQVTVLAERIRFGGEWTSRLGLRLNLSETLSIDVSGARVGPHPGRLFTIGLNQEFAR